MRDYVFNSFHSQEHQPLGGKISAESDVTTRIRLMLYAIAMPEVNDLEWHWGPPADAVEHADLGDRKVALRENPLSFTISRAGGDILSAAVEEFSRKNRRVALRIPKRRETRFYGLGGQFLGIEHSGKDIECQSTDVWFEKQIKKPEWSNTYFPIPLLITTDGYALLVNTTTPVRFDLTADDSYVVEVSSAALDLRVIECAGPVEAIKEYTALTGKPYVPAKWAMEPLIGHASDHAGKCFDARVLGEYLHQIEANDVPNGIIFDECWAWTSYETDEGGNRRLWFHPEKLGDFTIHNFEPETAGIEASHAAGQKVVLHLSPFIGIRSTYASELLEKGYLVMRASDPSLPLVGQYNHYYLDFTNPDAVKWWQEGVRRLISLGVDGFFPDFGESDDQRDALYSSGTGMSRGQEYCLLNKRALDEVCREMLPDGYFCISRAGWTGMQQYAGSLIGDQPGTFEGMALVLSAMQSLAMTGQGVAAHNLGGYVGEQDPTVYLRWVQLGVFSPFFVMWNSGTAGEPWALGEEALKHYRVSAQLRMRLLPYLHSCMCEYGETGVPMVRPMAMLYPRDADLSAREKQFMCGSELLVAPVFSNSGEQALYLPEGQWVDFWTGERLDGGREVLTKHSLDTFPIYVRLGGFVPMEIEPRRVNASESDLEINVFGAADNSLTFYDDGWASDLRGRTGNGVFELSFGPLKRPGIVWRFHAVRQPSDVIYTDASGTPEPLRPEPDGDTWTVRTPGKGGSIKIMLN